MHYMYLTLRQECKDTDERVNVWMNEQPDGWMNEQGTEYWMMEWVNEKCPCTGMHCMFLKSLVAGVSSDSIAARQLEYHRRHMQEYINECMTCWCDRNSRRHQLTQLMLLSAVM